MPVDPFESDGEAEVKLDPALLFPVKVDASHGRICEGDILTGDNVQVDNQEAATAFFQDGQEFLPGLAIGVDAGRLLYI